MAFRSDHARTLSLRHPPKYVALLVQPERTDSRATTRTNSVMNVQGYI